MTGLSAPGNSWGFGEVGRGGGSRRGLGLPETCAGADGRRNGGGGADPGIDTGNAFEIGNVKGGRGDVGVIDKGGIGDGDKTGARAKEGFGGSGGGVFFDGDESVNDEEGAVGVRRERGRRMTELD